MQNVLKRRKIYSNVIKFKKDQTLCQESYMFNNELKEMLFVIHAQPYRPVMLYYDISLNDRVDTYIFVVVFQPLLG